MASVKGSRIVNRDPLPWVESMNRPPPSFFTSVATTSMPTPRPAAWVTWPAVLKPGSRMSWTASSSVSFAWASASPSAMAFSRISLTLMPAPSSATTMTVSAPSRSKLMEIRPTSGLPNKARRSGASMPCTTELRSMCSSGATMRSSIWRSSSAAAPCTASSARLHVPLERHHARAHQTVLQFGNHPSLLRQQALRLPRQGFEQTLNARHIAGCLGQCARELLQGRVSIQLERIEIVTPRLHILVPMQHLCLGLYFQPAQLLLQARHRTRQLRQIEIDRVDLLIEAGAKDADLAGIVEHGVEQIRVNARHLHPLHGRCLAARQYRWAADFHAGRICARGYRSR